ncbi:hypothetical protein H257_01997 [Aphanomyces astaci]|uniref:Uncharacterized protein n=1 Tax=Aphanomyces astaci TaxID=112090 RepID=W4H6P8_APHAT|nr:hypothetical protein H257_01997 [Aphanomyces astaci]ETV86979.1 hypothetical protein H257_01997 [Aphanomyces astaci]|eukprot:XP_009823778.1 hypothetical protein H257_01997 [Aphanomyces astaci]
MGDADKAQHLGMTTAVDQQLSEIEYLMCFYRVIKKCYEKDADCELTNEEWRDVSFYIYLLHMSASHVDMGDLMEALKYRTDLKRLQATITYAGLVINFFHAEYESVMDFLIFLEPTALTCWKLLHTPEIQQAIVAERQARLGFEEESQTASH